MRSKTGLIGTAAAFLTATAYFFSTMGGDEPESPPQKAPTTSSTAHALPDTTALVAHAEQTTSAASTASAPIEGTEKKFETENDCISNMFLGRSQKASNTPDDKFSNLRWAVETYGSKGNTAAMLETAAQSLGMDKANLITKIRASAISVFKDTPTADLRNNWDWANYWNNQLIAHRYAGLTDTGEFNTGMSVSAVSYSYDNIKQNRDQYMVGAAMEAAATLKATLDTIEQGINNELQNGERRGSALSITLESIPKDQRVLLRDKIDFVLYASDTLNAGSRLGLSDEQLELAERINQSGYLSLFINQDFAKDCKTYQPK